MRPLLVNTVTFAFCHSSGSIPACNAEFMIVVSITAITGIGCQLLQVHVNQLLQAQDASCYRQRITAIVVTHIYLNYLFLNCCKYYLNHLKKKAFIFSNLFTNWNVCIFNASPNK